MVFYFPTFDFSPDSSGILLLFSLKSERYSGWRNQTLKKFPNDGAPKYKKRNFAHFI
ncbi:hypothetical protein FEDK69T_23540 [Flavobacterium enshiense DK69]|nr:hypothetical protein FEDK69T_23540 [Flavobacterium enshiense DK69]